MPTHPSAWWPPAASHRGPKPRPRAAGGNPAPDPVGRADPCAQQQIDADLGEVEAQLADLQERRVTAEARFEELDMQLADSQERQAQLGDRVIETERSSMPAANSSACLERQVQEATFSQRSLDARRAELNRSIETATQQARPSPTSSSAPRRTGPPVRRRGAGGLCSRRWT